MDGESIASLTVTGRIDQNALRVIPLRYLAEVAAAHLREVGRLMEAAPSRTQPGGVVVSGVPEWAARDVAATGSGTMTRRGDPPTPEQFARAWLATPAVAFPDGGGHRELVTRRQALAERFAVSVYRVDQWTRAARDRGLVPARDPKAGGAPRKPPQHLGQVRPSNRQEMTK